MILRQQFPLIAEADVSKILRQLEDPLAFQFRTVLYVADDFKGRVRGFAIVLNFIDLGFSFLDYLAAGPDLSGRGVGGALYEQARADAFLHSPHGLLFECLPDDPALCNDPVILKQNKRRLAFYEVYGARPVINTLYETPVQPGGQNPPYLVLDDLGRGRPLSRAVAQRIVRAMLDRKYSTLCSADCVEHVGTRSGRDATSR